MAYATSDVYSSELLELASSKVDELTFNRIRSIGYDNLSEFQKDCISRATVLQAEYYDNYGTDIGSLAGFSIPGLSMNLEDKNKGVNPQVIMLLKQTGLMNRVIV